jgi:ADP-heptose:LPS heptosyltransferase
VDETAGDVLVLRPDHLGDMVLFSGAFRHLRRHFPDARIGVAATPPGLEYLAGCPFVDELVPWPPVARGRVRRDRRWSTVLFPVRSPRRVHHETVRRLRARRAVGIAGDHANQKEDVDRNAARWYTSRLELAPERRTDHELIVTRDFLRHLGLDVGLEDLWPQTWTTPADREWAEHHVPLVDDQLTIAVTPAVAGDPTKLHLPDAFRAAFDSGWDAPVAIVVLGGPDDTEVCGAVAAALVTARQAAAVTNLAGMTTVNQLVEGLRRASGVVSVDAAPLHLATALRRPVVGIVGERHGGRFYPWGDPATSRTVRPMDAPTLVTSELRAAIAAARRAGSPTHEI